MKIIIKSKFYVDYMKNEKLRIFYKILIQILIVLILIQTIKKLKIVEEFLKHSEKLVKIL